MRLKKIPKGTQKIAFENPWPINYIVYESKKPFLMIRANSVKIIECRYFIVGHPLKEFPEMMLYGNLYISIQYI